MPIARSNKDSFFLCSAGDKLMITFYSTKGKPNICSAVTLSFYSFTEAPGSPKITMVSNSFKPTLATLTDIHKPPY
jgi:hypothetical protein